MILRTLAIGLALAGVLSAAYPPPAWAADGPLKVVVHINFPETGTQSAGLRSVGNILKEEPQAKIEVVCHAAGIGLLEKTRTDHAEAIGALIKQGVAFVACENTMRQKSIKKDDLLPGVGTVPSGALEVVRKQQIDGYAYFKP